MTFTFPYSHGLASSIGWSICTYILAKLGTRKHKSAFLLAVGVFSHFVLDYLVHPTEIALIDEQVTMMGLGLWNHLYVALAVELLFLLAGLYMYLKVTVAHTPIGNYGIIVFMSLLTISLFTGQLLSPKPESAYQIAVSSVAKEKSL